MKILVVQLLRVGDLIASAPIIKGLGEKFENAQIDVLVNRECRNILPVFSNVQKAHLFDRKLLQSGLGEVDRGLFEPYDRLMNLINEINSENYDLVINLTQNRLSAHIMGLIHCEEKNGLQINIDGRVEFGSDWFRYLNSRESERERIFHYTDVYKRACQIDPSSFEYGFNETDRGRGEKANLIGEGQKYILIQSLTSDEKKDWPREKFRGLIRNFLIFFPNKKILLLGAPNEREALAEIIRDFPVDRVQIAICSFEGAFSLLRGADLLVTGDTSIKHLASAAEAPMIEICLGGSDHRLTGAYAAGALILRSKEYCQPCVHSKNCHRERRFCADRISVEAVSLAAQAIVFKNSKALDHLSEEFRNDIEVFATEFSESGQWTAIPRGEAPAEDLEKAVLGATRRLNLSEAVELSDFGDEIRSLTEILKRFYKSDRQAVIDQMDRWGQELKVVEDIKWKASNQLRRAVRDFDQISGGDSFLSEIDDAKRTLTSISQPYINLLDNMKSFGDISRFEAIRKCRDEVKKLDEYLGIHQKVMRSLESEMERL